MPLHKVSQSTDTIWEKLTKRNQCFKFDKNNQKPIISYIDEMMEENFGPPSRETWTRKKLRSIKEKIRERIEEKMSPPPSSDSD